MEKMLLVEEGTTDILVQHSCFPHLGPVFLQVTESGLHPGSIAIFLTRDEARELSAALLNIANHAATPEEAA